MANFPTRRTALATLVGITAMGVAAPAGATPEEDDELADARELYSAIEDQLAKEGTTIEEQINSLKSETGSTSETSETENLEARGVSKEQIVRQAVNAIVAAFTAANLKLSAELLYHSTKKLGDVYVPKFRNRAKYTTTVPKIRKSAKLRGTASFPKKGGGKYGPDLYYGIHKCNYSKSGVKNPKVTISDIYDFADEKYSGIQGKAVATMHLAQKYGVVKAYTVKFTI
jgi:hypothetical protein